ncbi:MAG TPA: cobalamin-independent methionine synthase II family protein [Chloroflexota bacterium]
MQGSAERILTTHTGSLVRPDDLAALLVARDRGQPYDAQTLESRAREAVAAIVARQAAAGVDVVNDGEQSKLAYATYVKDRLTGFGPSTRAPEPTRPPRDLVEYPGYDRGGGSQGRATAVKPSCIGPVTYQGRAELERDISNLQAALADATVSGAFMTAASPGLIVRYLPNEHYPSDDAYLAAVADAMREEYAAIVGAGLVLQLDCPDLGSEGSWFPSVAEFRKYVASHVEAINHAVADLPPERLRLHVCWGNYEGPHTHDVPLADIVDLLLQARPAGLVLEAANPRHAHEWHVWEDVKLPDDKFLVTGVLDTTTNFVEHPDLVADRLIRYASLVGRERVMAGSDCGFATWVGGTERVDPRIAWAKLEAMAEGARRATRALWHDGR